VSLFSRDTRPEIAELMVEADRKMTPAQKFARVFELRYFTRQLAAARIRKQYPAASDREVQLRIGALTLDRDIMVKVFGWDPEKEGW